ncbi:hypothetical protein [Cryobacterium sp. Y11]|uniref:hypothetical protein n=1 Tax=Cryobacterium sp. Y11 TaxID=2045016 RepID=UPI0018EB01A6|nr:hypothetical protein [Cryobacterium sp. Y11]
MLHSRRSHDYTGPFAAGLGELYDSVRGRGVYFHSYLNENDRPGSGKIDVVRSMFGTKSYLGTYDAVLAAELTGSLPSSGRAPA